MKKRIVSLLIALFLTMPLTAYAEEQPAPATTPAAETTQPAEQPAAEAAKCPVLGPPATIIVNRDTNTCAVYDKDNNLLKLFTVSTGREGHRTPLGTYKVYEHVDKGGYHAMVDGTYGRWCMRWKKGGYMFHTVCYAKNGDPEPIAQEVEDLGKNVSRGCVRLSVTDAEWLYNNTPNGCVVIITENPKETSKPAATAATNN